MYLSPLGTNFCDRSRDFNLGLYVRFASKDALDFYQPHPIHEEFKATVVQKDGTALFMLKESGHPYIFVHYLKVAALASFAISFFRIRAIHHF